MKNEKKVELETLTEAALDEVNGGKTIFTVNPGQCTLSNGSFSGISFGGGGVWADYGIGICDLPD